MHFKWNGPVGCGFPAAIQNGIVRTAANIDKSWIGTDANELFSDWTGLPVTVVNDADAAGDRSGDRECSGKRAPAVPRYIQWQGIRGHQFQGESG
jgi:hypothetical protein